MRQLQAAFRETGRQTGRFLVFCRVMARLARTVVVNVPQHLTQCGGGWQSLPRARRKAGNFPSVPGFPEYTTAFVGGCLLLLVWFAEGMSL